MANCIKLASDALYTLILEGLGRLVADQKLSAEPIPAFKIEIPADKSHGDFAANVAMVSAKCSEGTTSDCAAAGGGTAPGRQLV